MNRRPQFTNRDICKKVDKNWGKEYWIENNDKFCAKILCFNRYSKFSAHLHLVKSELFTVLSGEFLFMYIDGETAQQFTRNLKPGDSVFIPTGCVHQVTCLSENGGEIFESSTHHEDSDSIRVLPGDSQKQ